MGRLQVNKLSVAYRTSRILVRAVTDVTFHVDDGEVLALWGHSGCGKSTIMKALLGLPLDDPGWVAGEATFDGRPVSPSIENHVVEEKDGSVRKNSLAFHRRHQQLLRPYLGPAWRVVLQEPIYSFELSRFMSIQIRESLKEMTNNGISGYNRLFNDFSSYLKELDLTVAYIESRTNLQLSGGECQRIALALNLAGNPKLMFIDEPTTAMDDQTRQAANGLIRNKVAQSGTSILLASHNRDELLALADRIIVLCGGEVVEEFERKVMDDTSVEKFHPYTRKLWFSMDAGELAARGGAAETGARKQGCPFVMECPVADANPQLKAKCAVDRPTLKAVAGNHSVACWAIEGTD